MKIKVNGWLREFEAGIAGALLLASLAIVILEILSRELTGASFLWSEEMSRYTMIWMALFGMVAALVDGTHIKVDFLRNRLPIRFGQVLDLFGLLSSLIFSLYVFWYGLVLVSDSRMLGIVSADSNIGLPVWIFQSIIPLAFGLLSARIAVLLVKSASSFSAR